MRPVSKTIRWTAGAFANSAAMAAVDVAAFTSRTTLPSRSITQMCVSFIEMSKPAKCSMVALLWRFRADLIGSERAAVSLPHVAKVGKVGQSRNVCSAAERFLNLSVRTIPANESILRVSAVKGLLQHYLPKADIRWVGQIGATASNRRSA